MQLKGIFRLLPLLWLNTFHGFLLMGRRINNIFIHAVPLQIEFSFYSYGKKLWLLYPFVSWKKLLIRFSRQIFLLAITQNHKGRMWMRNTETVSWNFTQTLFCAASLESNPHSSFGWLQTLACCLKFIQGSFFVQADKFNVYLNIPGTHSRSTAALMMSLPVDGTESMSAAHGDFKSLHVKY